MNATQLRRAKKLLVDSKGSLEQWFGRCYQAAICLEDAGLGTARYGLWWGPVARKAQLLFQIAELDNGLSFTRHGWLELPDGEICDPTRWAFEGVEPYIWVGGNDHYDHGGNRLRKLVPQPAPPYEAENYIECDFEDDTWWWVQQLAIVDIKSGDVHTAPTLPLLFWLANLPPETLGTRAEEIYRVILDAGYAAFIPIDNQEVVIRGRSNASNS